MIDSKKISVIGNSGAGKSTISQKLGELFGIEVFSIDTIYWLPGWVLRNENSFDNLHNRWIKQKSWIIEGIGYWNALKYRLDESDMIIFLDIPVEICKERAEKRIQDEESNPNPFITEGCVYGNMRDKQIKVIDTFQNTFRAILVKYLSGIDQEKVRIITELSDLNLIDLT